MRLAAWIQRVVLAAFDPRDGQSAGDQEGF